MDADARRLNEISEAIIGCAFAVSNELGPGFLAKVYENALHAELTLSGMRAVQQAAINVCYRGIVVDKYLADLLVESEVIVEIKCASGVDQSHIAQALNYLKATGKKLALILNFQKSKVEIKRVVRGL